VIFWNWQFPRQYNIYCTKFGWFWHEFRGPYNKKGTKFEELTCAHVQEILGMNFEEFGSDFEVETWHGFRDKSVFNFEINDCCKRHFL
jgi:hypothetical protein